MSTSNNNSRGKKRVITGVFLALIIAGCVYGLLAWHTRSNLKTLYIEYAAAEEEHETAAYKPSVGSNPIRQAVSVLLAQVLQMEMTPTVRLEKAKQGIAHLNDMELQIDAVKDQGDKVEPLLKKLESAQESMSNAKGRSLTKELVTLAKRQVEIIADIRGLSYRADYYTDEIFERIIDEQGEMTDEHKTYLNSLLPQLEEQFDKRTNLYTELGKNTERMKQIAAELGFVVAE